MIRYWHFFFNKATSKRIILYKNNGDILHCDYLGKRTLLNVLWSKNVTKRHKFKHTITCTSLFAYLHRVNLFSKLQWKNHVLNKVKKVFNWKQRWWDLLALEIIPLFLFWRLRVAFPLWVFVLDAIIPV